jgi:DNA invertase Pin-like site-specific DNA recombinase
MKNQRIIHELKPIGDNKKSGKLRVAAYIRVSSDSEDQLDSYTAQYKHYTDLIDENHKWELASIYADEGITGTKTDLRDDFNRMITDCEKGRIDLILVKSVSRFARNTKDCIDYVRKLKTHGVAIRFEKENIDTSDLKNELELTMHGLLAEGESHSISRNLRQSYTRRMESGEFNTCRAPIGFTLEHNCLKVNEKDAVIVREIFDLFLSGVGKSSIADILNSRGVQNWKGTKWGRTSVDYIIRNERYMGEALLQKRYTTEEFPFAQKVNKGELRKYHVTKSNPEIIDKNTFVAAQDLVRKRRNISGTSTAGSHLFSRKIICTDCGKYFRRKVSRRTVNWVCSYGNEALSKCSVIRIAEDRLIETTALMLNKLAGHKEYIIDSLISNLAKVQIRSGRCAVQICEIDKKVAELEKKSHVIAKLKVKEILSGIAFSERSNEVDRQLLELRKERMRIIKGDPDERAIEKLKSLRERLLGYDGGDTSYFERFVKEHIARILPSAEEDEMVFELTGGLALPERMI